MLFLYFWKEKHKKKASNLIFNPNLTESFVPIRNSQMIDAHTHILYQVAVQILI